MRILTAPPQYDPRMATTDLAEPDVAADRPPLPRPLWRPIPGNAVMAWLGPLLVAA
ncbi:MAG: hypothetical protein QOD45_1160, partial [Pseudonocardiales bacterium]|nr:hypothetical protein [Pseudonocardiales bacterium]